MCTRIVPSTQNNSLRLKEFGLKLFHKQRTETGRRTQWIDPLCFPYEWFVIAVWHYCSFYSIENYWKKWKKNDLHLKKRALAIAVNKAFCVLLHSWQLNSNKRRYFFDQNGENGNLRAVHRRTFECPSSHGQCEGEHCPRILWKSDVFCGELKAVFSAIEWGCTK